MVLCCDGMLKNSVPTKHQTKCISIEPLVPSTNLSTYRDQLRAIVDVINSGIQRIQSTVTVTGSGNTGSGVTHVAVAPTNGSGRGPTG